MKSTHKTTTARTLRATWSAGTPAVVACTLLFLLLFALPSAAQPSLSAQRSSAARRRQQQQITQAQAELYERWRANINLNQGVAFEAGREYAEKYPNDEYALRVRGWVADYERAARKLQFEELLFKEKKYAAAFKVGKQVLGDEPDNLRTIINLASTGYLASNTGDALSNAETLEFARRATAMLEAGDKPSDFKPFTGQPDALAYLNFITGELILKETPAESVAYFRKAIESEGTIKNTPVIYTRLAAAYVASQYEPQSKEFAANFGGKEATPESKVALDNINRTVDLITDALARAIALSGAGTQDSEARARWMQELTRFYKFRNNNSTDGLEAYIAGTTARPLP
jgi:nucleoid-associated protein YgaU